MQGKRNGLSDLFLLEKRVCGLDNVLQQHSNSHGPNTTGNWGDDGGDFGSGLELDITHESLTGLARGIRNVVGSHINNNSTRLQPLTLDKVGGANGNDDNVGVLEMGLEVGRGGVADGNGGIGSVQELSNGTANNIASAEDHSVLARKFNTSLLQQSDDTLGSARCEDGCATTLGKLADVVGAEAVNILLVSDGGRDDRL